MSRDTGDPFSSGRPRVAVLAGALGQGNLGDDALAEAFESAHGPMYERIIRLMHRDAEGRLQVQMPGMPMGVRRWRGRTEREDAAKRIIDLAEGLQVDYVWVGGLFGEPVHVRGRTRELVWSGTFAERLIYYFGDAEDKILHHKTTHGLVHELNRANAWIGVRSAEAAEVLQRSGVTHQIHIGMDPVLRQRLQAPCSNNHRTAPVGNHIALCPARPVGGDLCARVWIGAAAAAARRGWTVAWLPFHPEEDLQPCRILRDAVAQMVPSAVQRIIDRSDVLHELEAASLCVSARYHGVIFSLTARVPTVGLCWNSKISRIMRLLQPGLEQFTPDTDSEKAGEVVLSELGRRSAMDLTAVRELQQMHSASAASLSQFIRVGNAKKRADTHFVNAPPSNLHDGESRSRSARSIVTFCTAAAFTATATLIGLFATPHLLRWLGTEKFGAFRALSEWMGYLSLLELGLTGASMTVLAKAVAQGPGAAASATRVCVRAFSRVAVGMFVGGLIICAVAPALVPVSESIRGDLRFAALILAMGALLVPFNPFRLLLESAQRGYIVNLLLVVNSVVLTSLALVFAYRGGGVTGQAGATVLTAVAFSTAIGIFAWRQWLRLHRSSDGARTWSELLWKSNWQTIALDISGRVAVMSDNIIIGYILGPAAVTPFVLTQRLIQVGTGQVLGIGNSSWAALASLYHSGQHELMRRRLLELSRLAAVLAGVVIIPLTAYNHAFVRLWVGESFYGGDRLTALAGVVGLLAGWWSLWGWVFRGAGILSPVVPTSIASASVNVLVSVVATAALGWLEGPLIGTVAGFVLVTAWRYPLMFKRYFGLSPTRMITALLPMLLAFFAAGTAAWWIARRWPPQGWVTLAASIAAVAVGFAVFAIIVLLTREERQLWRQRVMMLIAGTNC